MKHVCSKRVPILSCDGQKWIKSAEGRIHFGAGVQLCMEATSSGAMFIVPCSYPNVATQQQFNADFLVTPTGLSGFSYISARQQNSSAPLDLVIAAVSLEYNGLKVSANINWCKGIGIVPVDKLAQA